MSADLAGTTDPAAQPSRGHLTPPGPAAARHDEAEHRQAANRAVGASALGLALTGGIELLLAIVTGSVALLGDALHNLSDVSTSAVVFVGFRISERPPSRTHGYGYERAEDLAGLGVALVIWLSAIFAGYQSFHKLVTNGGTSHLVIGMAGAVLGIVGNQVVARYKLRVGTRIQSATLVADARHSWLDALSSLGALIGLAAVSLGARWGDAVAGFAVTLFILHVGYEVTTGILGHLMDGVEEDDVVEAQRAAETVVGIGRVRVRGRWMGRSLLLDVEGALPATTALSESDRVGRCVEAAVLDAVPPARRVRWQPRGD